MTCKSSTTPVMGIHLHDIHSMASKLETLTKNQQLDQNDIKSILIVIDLNPEPMSIDDELESSKLTRKEFAKSIKKLAELKLIDWDFNW
ncbi:hypothetical protein C5Z25_12065 [Lactobacillus sp. CBA3605]|uniref:hypothetical protein n=1 Tax=Lactobacillus sp. CBA3605 TaxID=2099788 RepID=UPI000CFDFCF3|nr:hypothetical protein [Lactobacillus sp. CBA3605]AVK62448.1 hypothetical protein C5Z25_12065 [Lactobacillus sp. CBA3605]